MSKRLICGIAIFLFSFFLACAVLVPDTKTFFQGVIVTILIIIIVALITINSILKGDDENI